VAILSTESTVHSLADSEHCALSLSLALSFDVEQRVERAMSSPPSGTSTSATIILIGVVGVVAVGIIFTLAWCIRGRRYSRLGQVPSGHVILQLPDLDYRFQRPPLSNRPTWSAELPQYCPALEEAGGESVVQLAPGRPAGSRMPSSGSLPPAYSAAEGSLV